MFPDFEWSDFRSPLYRTLVDWKFDVHQRSELNPITDLVDDKI